MQSSSARIRRTRRHAARCQPLYDRAASGVRTVQLCRGARGFGFTISGQAPCVLSCVAPDSAADAAGLRPGDCLLTVNGRSVADSRHDRVVQLVGACVGQLQLQVADGRPLTDSSDEEACGGGGGDLVVDQRELRTPPRVASATGRTSAGAAVNWSHSRRSAARGGGVSGGGDGAEQCASLPRAARKCHRCAAAAASSSGDCRHCQPATRLRVVVGYLGSIEMPKLTGGGGGGSGSDAHLTAIGSCVRRLRVEKKVHTLVLMSVRLDGVVLSSIDGGVLARYAAACITFCGVCGDDRRFFGLVTASAAAAAAAAGAAGGDKPSGASHASSSCHVFMVDARLVAHVHHVRTARAFGVRCTGETTPDDSVCEQEATCREFPASSRPILRALVSLYRNRHVPGDTGAVVVAASSAPASWCGSVDDGGRDSPALSAGAAEAAAAAVVTPSSNSDSGVGFRDDMRLMNGRAVVAGRMRRGIPGDMAPPPAPPPVHCQSHHRRTVSGRLDGAAAGRRRADLTVSAGGYHTAGRVAGGMLGAHSAVVRSLDDVRLSAARHRRCGLHSRPHSSAGLPPLLPPPPPTTTTTMSRHMQRLCEESTWQTAGVVVGLDDVGSNNNNNDVDDVRVGNTGDSLPENGVVPTSRCSSLSMAVQASHGRVSPSRCPATMPPHVDTDAARAPKSTSTTASVKKAALLRPQHYETLDGGCDTADGAVLSSSAAGSSAAANAAVGSRVAGWSQSFDQLLHDPAGLHTFSEFLKSQFSHENIYFWAGCERYKRLATRGQRAAAARRLYDRHLCPGAPEPVNIDCHAHQYTLDQLTAVETMAASAAGEQHVDQTLFDKAQQQIYKLMLYDCYPRFLKSSLLQDCEFLEQSGEPLPYLGDHLMDDDLRVQPARALQPPSVSSSGIKKFGRFVTGGARHNEQQQQQQQRRKSLLPWSRHKERAKSKDRGETEYNRLLTMKKRHKKPATSVPVALSDREDGGGGGSVRSSLSGSRTSLASAGNNVAVTSAFSDLSAASLATRWPSRELLSPEAGDSCDDDDGGGGGGGAASSRTLPERGDCGLCRVLLPDRSWAVVQTVAGVSVRALLRRVLERRGLLAPPSGGGGSSSEQRSWDVYICGVQRPLNQSLDSTLALAGRQVRMEQRVLFRLQLPPAVVEHVNNGCGDGQAASVGKAVGVKARPNRRVREVLQPILAKYAVNLEQCVVSKCGGGVVDLNVSVTCIDNMSLRVNRAASSCGGGVGGGGVGGGGDVSLDVITSRVFDELLRARADELILDDIDAEESTDAKQYTGDAVFVSSSTSQVLGSRNDSRAFMNGGGECWLSGEPDTASDKSGRLASQTVSRHSHHHHHHHHHQNHRRRSATDTHINFDPPDFLDGGQVPAGGPPRARLDVTLTPPPSNEFHRRSVSLVCSPPPPPLPPKPRASVALDASVPRRQDRDPPAPPPTSSSLHQQRLVSERSRRAVYIDKTDALSISFV